MALHPSVMLSCFQETTPTVSRVCAYSMFIPLTCAPLGGLLVSIGYAAPSRLGTMVSLIEVMLAVPMLITIVIWWAVAIKRYLKMPHGALVSFLLAVMAVLVPYVLLITLKNVI